MKYDGIANRDSAQVPVRDVVREQIVNDHIAHWQPRLGLLAWDIRYNPNRKVGKGLAANSSNQNYMKLCEIGIQPDCPDDQLEVNVLHELLHIVVDPLYSRGATFAGALGNGSTAPVLLDQLHDIEETLIESLCFALTNTRPTVFGKAAKKHWPTFLEAA